MPPKNVTEILHSLALAKDRCRMQQMMAQYQRHNQHNANVMQALLYIESISNKWRFKI